MLYVLLMIVQLLGGSLEATVLNVNPNDSLSYQTIAAALDSCEWSDTLMLSAGTHHVSELSPIYPLTIMGHAGGDDRPRLVGKQMIFRDDVCLQNLIIDSMLIAIEGLQGFVLNNVINTSGIWCELSRDILIVNNEFNNSGAICYGTEPEFAFNTFKCDSLHDQGTALRYMNGPGLLPHINIHHNSFINYPNAVELDWPCQPSCKGDFIVDLSDNWWGVTDTAIILALSGESEMGDIGTATIEYKMDSFWDTPPGSLGFVADSVYGLSYNTFEDVSHAVVIGTYRVSIKERPGIGGISQNVDQSGTAVYLSIDGRVVSDRARVGKGVYIEVHGNTVKKVLLLKR